MCEAKRTVAVTAPCRLHFGLLAFGVPRGRQYGGVGVMIDKPAVRLCVSPSAAFSATGPAAARAEQFATAWARFSGFDGLPRCQIDVTWTSTQHSGLGVGTQLGLSVAAALNAWCGLDQPSPAELAISVGRGRRSAVGTYGFAEGGLIVERGKLLDEPIAPLDCRLDLPDDWRFLLIQPRSRAGLSGAAEHRAFTQLPPVPDEVTAALHDEIRTQMVPAAARGDFNRFSDSVYCYGRLAGSCFTPVQGGPYNGPLLTGLVDLVRRLGVTGVGQSSWGPTLFAVLQSEGRAAELADRLQHEPLAAEASLSVCAADNRGARLQYRGPAV
jgi:beta-RFAP synthase